MDKTPTVQLDEEELVDTTWQKRGAAGRRDDGAMNAPERLAGLAVTGSDQGFNCGAGGARTRDQRIMRVRDLGLCCFR